MPFTDGFNGTIRWRNFAGLLQVALDWALRSMVNTAFFILNLDLK